MLKLTSIIFTLLPSAIRRSRKKSDAVSPESQDALHGPHVILAVAQIYAMVNDADAALPLLEHLLSTASGVSARLVALDPIWDPLRTDPRFKKILEEAAKPLPL